MLGNASTYVELILNVSEPKDSHFQSYDERGVTVQALPTGQVWPCRYHEYLSTCRLWLTLIS